VRLDIVLLLDKKNTMQAALRRALPNIIKASEAAATAAAAKVPDKANSNRLTF